MRWEWNVGGRKEQDDGEGWSCVVLLEGGSLPACIVAIGEGRGAERDEEWW